RVDQLVRADRDLSAIRDGSGKTRKSGLIAALELKLSAASFIYPDPVVVITPAGAFGALRVADLADQAHTAARIRGAVLASVIVGRQRLATNILRELAIRCRCRQTKRIAFVDDDLIA